MRQRNEILLRMGMQVSKSLNVMSNSNVNAAKGRRYTAKEKAEIIAYVDKVNAEKGRGGQSAASKKYQISPLTISSWIRSGVGGGSGIPSLVSVRSGASVAGPIGKKLAKLQELVDQIARTEKDLAKLRSQFDTLKASL